MKKKQFWKKKSKGQVWWAWQGSPPDLFYQGPRVSLPRQASAIRPLIFLLATRWFDPIFFEKKSHDASSIEAYDTLSNLLKFQSSQWPENRGLNCFLFKNSFSTHVWHKTLIKYRNNSDKSIYDLKKPL
jgi:hypothetical protein